MPPLFHLVAEPIGIDLGVSTFATLSDGKFYESPRPLKKAKTKLIKELWRNRQKQLGNINLGVIASKNAHKDYRRIAKTHSKNPKKRRDFLPKNTTKISDKYPHIRLKILKVSGMVANPKLAAAISDCGCSEFRHQLEYKSEMYGTKVGTRRALSVLNRWFPASKACSNCGHTQPMPLQEPVFDCGCCALLINRDWNAAINLSPCSELVRPVRSLRYTCGQEGADSLGRCSSRTSNLP